MIVAVPEGAFGAGAQFCENFLGRAQRGGWLLCTIFMAEAISAETSLILLGTIRVVVASAATFP